MPGFIGWLLRYCDTLPLSSSPATMRKLSRAVAQILQRGDHILVYPEQAMWWNYEKPRPYMIGAFYYAAKNGVPVVPCFVTMRPGGKKPPFDRFYTVHILDLIYPDAGLSVRENAEAMMRANAAAAKEVYERVYGRKLVYSCEEEK